MDAVMCASSQIRGRWGPLQMHPLLRLTLIYAPPLPPPVTVPLPPDEWESPRYQLCHHAGVVPNPPASCAFQNLKARLSYLMILYDFCVCMCVYARARARFCWPGSLLPPVFQLGSPKSMAAELDKIRNRTNCAYSLYCESQQFLKCNSENCAEIVRKIREK